MRHLVLFGREKSVAWQPPESMTNNRVGIQDSEPGMEQSLQISVETGKLGSTAAETSSPMTPRTAKMKIAPPGLFSFLGWACVDEPTGFD
jgi:hypothetical protein